MTKKVNQLTLITLFFIFVNLFWSCDTQKSNESTDSIAIQDEVPVNQAPSEVTVGQSLIDLILKTEKGTERFKEIDQSLSSAMQKETLEMVDSASNYKGYTQYFNNSDDQFVDIQYYNNGDKVTGINFDIYLNTASDVNNLLNDLVAYFDKNYGKSVKKTQEYNWQLTNGQVIVLKDVSVKLAPGLQLTINKKGEDLTQ